MLAEPFINHDAAGGRLLMVTDGVWKYCGYEALEASFALPLAALAEHFRSSILRRAGTSLPDDISVVALDTD